jgi:predicted permease
MTRPRITRSPITTWMSGSELRLGLRWIRKQPVMAATAVLALAAGIGLAATGAAVLQATVFAELPLDGADRFVRLRAFAEPGGRQDLDLDRYHRLAESAESFAEIGAIGARRVNLRHPSGAVEPERAALITASSFGAVPGVPVLGRILTVADGETGAPPVVLLRESLWQRRFAGDPGVVGSTIEVAGVARTVVGVMTDGYEFPAGGELWIPLDDRHLGGSAAGPEAAPQPGLEVFAVLREGVAREVAQAEVDALVAPAAGDGAAEPEVRVRVVPYTEPPEGWNLMITTLVGVLVLVLLVIAANVANLIAARTAARTSELAVRTALGASRGRLIGQLTAETALLGALAAALGLAGSGAALRWLDANLGAEMPFWIDFTPGSATAAAVVALTLLATLVAGVLPALRATRRDPAGRLRAAAAGGGGVGRLGTAMVVVEMALSVALLTGALVMARGFALSTGDRLDLPHGEILTVWIGEPASAPGVPPLRPAIVRAAAAIPGVTAAGAASHLPRIDPPARRTELAPEPGDRGIEGAAEPVAAPMAHADAGYFDALGAQALSGRLFREADLAPGAPPVAVVNQPFVDRFLAGRNPIGRRLRLADPGGASGEEAGCETGPEPWYEIVGVVPDLGLSVADPSMAAGWYAPLDDAGGGRDAYYLAVRTAGDPLALAGPLRRALADLDPEIDVHRLVPLERVGWEDRAFMSGFGSALSGLRAMALLLSLAGIYAMLSFAVTRRTREIGVRVALGATGAQVLRSIVGGTGLRLAAGAALGAVLALALIEAKAMLVTRLPAGEPWILPAVLGLLLAAGLAASWVPSQRALAIRPSDALRSE